jgi:hypothetical protein
VTEETEIFNPSNTLTWKDGWKGGCVGEIAQFQLGFKHRVQFNICPQFEGFWSKRVKKSPRVSEQLQEKLRKINEKYGEGKAPLEREWKLFPMEMFERFDALDQAEVDSGLGGIEVKSADSIPEIPLYDADPFVFISGLVQERIDKIKNAVIMLVGDTGSGKSYSALDLARNLDKNFTLEGICLSAEEFFNRFRNTGESTVGRVTVADDLSKWANSREYGGDLNILLAKMFDIFRSRGEILILTAPKETKIDKSIRENIHIYLLAPDKQDAGIFEPADPVWNDRGTIDKLNYYRFNGKQYTPVEWGNAGEITLRVESVRFPFSGMHQMSENEIEECGTTSERPKKGRDCKGIPYPEDPFLREYELKKAKVFSTYLEEGARILDDAEIDKRLKEKSRRVREMELDRKLNGGSGQNGEAGMNTDVKKFRRQEMIEAGKRLREEEMTNSQIADELSSTFNTDVSPSWVKDNIPRGRERGK